MELSEKTKKLCSGSSVIRKLFEEGNEMAKRVGAENVFDFSLGNPSVEPPAKVKETICRLLDENPMFVHGYMSNSGYPEVKKTVADSLNAHYGMNYSANNIIMTVGAAGGLNCIFRAMLNDGDEVLCFAPFFGEYRNYVFSAGGNLVPVPADTKTFQPNVDAMASYVTEKTKIILLNNPNNPTGVIYSEETLKKLSTAIAECEKRIGHSLCVISDEPYRELVYDGNTVPYLPKFIKNSVVAYSYSKSLSLPGERIGYLAVSPDFEDAENFIAGLTVNLRIGYVNAPSLFQLVVKECLEEKVDLEFYDKNRRTLYEGLSKLGFECVKPEGAFYLFVKSPVADENVFVAEAKKFNIIMVPATSFGCPGYVRLAYCISYDKIVRSLEAFKKLASAMNV
ncbi:MAG: pyridoxal phosphate-dependent aminotransferase [Treponema sp.]|nr:pyridoxal phosphate-dependent aminotransferase [Treponema sp.]